MTHLSRISCVALVTLSAFSIAVGQNSSTVPHTKVVRLESSIHTYPCDVTAVRLAWQLVHRPFLNREASFQAGDDWMRGLTFVIKNRTQKKIIGAVLHLDFPDTETGDNLRMGHAIRVGTIPERAQYTKEGKRVPIAAAPPLDVDADSTFRISLTPYYDELKDFIETRQPISTINSVWVRLATFYFDDGTRWTTGSYQRPDLSKSYGYESIRPAEFGPIDLR